MTRARTIAEFGDGITDADLPAGSVLQVVQSVKTDRTTYSVATLTESSNIMTVSITPSSTSSKILLRCSVHMDVSTITAGLILNDGSTNIHIADAAGVVRRATTYGYSDADRVDTMQLHVFEFLHSPSTTDEITYGIKGVHSSGSTQTLYVNHSESAKTQSKEFHPVSSFTAMEIAG